MKQILMTIAVLAGISAKAQIMPLELESYKNFGMPALSVQPMFSSKVAIRIDEAMLLYADDAGFFEEKHKNLEKLQTAYALKELNSLTIHFEDSDCKVNTTHKDVFYCTALSPRSIYGAEVDYYGSVVQMSGVTLTSIGEVYIVVSKRLQIELHHEYTTYQAQARLVVPLNSQENFSIRATKDDLGIRQPF